mmetsp:Transcript_7283/g.32304  ORF Transcript_7283/g.32304 Transcript_7283/m.32304 type:complete len:377 (-) Transcript_7283:1749-2879(-)
MATANRLTKAANELVDEILLYIETSRRSESSSSLLLIGPRGSGKSAIVKKVIERLECNPVVVHLRGLLQSNDDRQAYASLVHQLGVGGTQVLNATIPRLFEISAKAISEGAKNSQTYVVILEDFEIFALRPKQAFLYSLFNLAQGSDVGIVLIGTSIRIDAADLLEKRVRSRFSERVLVVPRPADVDEVESLVAQNNDGYRSTKANRQRIADQLKIDRVMGTILMRAAYDGQDLTAGSPYLVLGDVVEEVLLGLSTLEIALLISYRRLVMRKGIDNYNFSNVYEEYASMNAGEGRRRAKTNVNLLHEGDALGSGGIVSKRLAHKAWTQLLDSEVLECGAEGTHLTVTLHDIKAAMDRHEGVNATLRAWGGSFITPD